MAVWRATETSSYQLWGELEKSYLVGVFFYFYFLKTVGPIKEMVDWHLCSVLCLEEKKKKKTENMFWVGVYRKPKLCVKKNLSFVDPTRFLFRLKVIIVGLRASTAVELKI